MKRGYMFPEELESDADPDALVERRVASYEPLERERFRHITAGDKTIEVHREKLVDGTSICTYTDITDRVRAEREVERQREALHQSEKLSALGMLLAGVAHELNNPLQVVLGNAALLENDSVNRDLSNRAGTIRDAAERCAKIVKTFLAMARDAPASKAPVDLNDLIRRAFNLIGYQLRSKDIGYKLELSPDLPPVVGDADQLNQVIVNLLLNAMHALEQSDSLRQIWVRTSFHDEDRVILLEVSDTGHGVPEEVRGRIFDPFFTTKPVGLGTGIGLAVCHGMVAAHGGTISVDDAPGGGARFAVRLPEGAGLSGAAARAGEEPAGTAGGRVLVIDDEPEIRELLGDILEPTGFEIETAASGREALGMIASRRYAAIVCDLRMPDLDGPGLYGEVARQVPEALNRFVFATGDLLNDAADGFLTETGRPCLAKPFLPQQVRMIVSEVAGRQGGAADRSA
jgi:signal transduction histidine kinase